MNTATNTIQPAEEPFTIVEAVHPDMISDMLRAMTENLRSLRP